MAEKAKVEVVIPVFNEEKELEENIKKLHSFLGGVKNQFDWHITIVDNASIDDSLEIAQSLASKLTQVSALHVSKKGRGRAVKTAWMNSNADYASYMDVDLSTDLRIFPKLIDALIEGSDIAIGSRLLPQSKVDKRPVKREILSRIYNILIKIFFQVNFSDAQCGFKAVNKKVVQNLIPKIADNEWFFDSELLIVGEKMGYTIKELPVVWVDNPGSTVRVLRTVMGDLKGLSRLFVEKPWSKKTK